MSDGLERLRSIGAQKIHEDTHIALIHVQSILHESFEGIQKVQLLGFISIMEREYKVDLHPLRERAREYFDAREEELPKEYVKEPSPTLPTKHKVLLGVLIVLFFIMSFVFYTMFSSSDETINNQNYKEQKTTIEQPLVNKTQVDTNTTQENNETVQNNQDTKRDPVVEKKPQKLVIIPRTKVWLGYIDLESHKKKQTVTKEPLELDGSKDYLLTFGHGYIDIKVGDKLHHFKKAKNVKFVYENGELKAITNDEFKARNKGKLW